MNNHINKIFALPFALFFLFTSTFFLTGCFCATPGKDPIITTMSITNLSIKNDTDFANLIGKSSSGNNSSILTKLMGLYILNNKKATDSVKIKIVEKARSLGNLSKFIDDYKLASSGFTKIELIITSSSSKELLLQDSDDQTNTKKISSAPTDWSQTTNKNQIKADELSLELTFFSDVYVDSSTENLNKYKIIITFKNVKFQFDKNFKIKDESGTLITTITIKNITKITT